MSNAPWAVLLLMTKYSLFGAIVLPKSLCVLSGVTPFQAADATLPLRQLPTDIPAWFQGDGCKRVSGSCCSAWMVSAWCGGTWGSSNVFLGKREPELKTKR